MSNIVDRCEELFKVLFSMVLVVFNLFFFDKFLLIDGSYLMVFVLILGISNVSSSDIIEWSVKVNGLGKISA